jgi:hypothetical protein
MNNARIKDLTNQKFGKLVALNYNRRFDGNRWRSYWLCKCDCGNESNVLSNALISGRTEMCVPCGKKVNFKHGHSIQKESKTYFCWQNMLNRCYWEKGSHYSYYGGRGITVCDRWQGESGFENFLADMGEKPEGKSIDRINTNGNYEPGNCRWSTDIQQANNKRNNVFITYHGETKTMAEWGRVLGIKLVTIKYRFDNGIDIGLPVRKQKLASPKTGECENLPRLTS